MPRDEPVPEVPTGVAPFDETGIPDGRIQRYANSLVRSAENRLNSNYAADDILLLVARAYRKGVSGEPLVPSDMSQDDLKDNNTKGYTKVAQATLRDLSVQHYLKGDPEYKRYL